MNGDFDPGVPLHRYRGVSSRIELWCASCCTTRVFELEGVIARLKARGVGDENTGVREVARYVTEPCQCGGTRFETRPHFSYRPNP